MKMLSEEILKEELWLALSRKKFFVMYQPIISTRNSEVSFEDYQDGIMQNLIWFPPNSLIKIAEQIGTIFGLSTFVIKNALRILKGNSTIDFINVNLSLALFDNREWFEKLIDLLKFEYPDEVKRFRFEITEGITIKKNNLDLVKTLRDEGSPVYVDDFGIGYSSFQYLIESVFNGSKMDRIFTKLIGTEKETIVNDLIQLANNLQLSVVVEDVKGKEQLDYLKNTSFDYL